MFQRVAQLIYSRLGNFRLWKQKKLSSSAGKPVLAVNPRHTSQECPKCHHTEKGNRDGEKFVCRSCGYSEHADTGASRFPSEKERFIISAESKKTTCGLWESNALEDINTSVG
jgi:transposase-like protein